MTREEAKHKLDFMKKAYQKLIDEKVDSGKLVGDGVRGEWKAEAPLDEAYKDMIEALDMAIKALEQQQRDCNTCKHSDNGNCAYTEECHECMWKSKYEKQPCEDCISRQAVLDMATTIQTDDFSGNEIIEVVDIDDIKALPPVQPTRPTGRWIPCTERLPEDGDTYLVTIEHKGKVIGVDAASYSPVEGYIDKHWDTFNDWKEDEDSCYHVSAWMPLPKPYKAESEEEYD